jgi:hypothetical protein
MTTEIRPSERAYALLEGAVDMHVHFAPDAFAERRMDAHELVAAARARGMGGLVLKSHEYPTAPLAWALRDEAGDLDLFGAVALDHAVGGINRDAVEVSLRVGASVVWMPTFDSAHWRDVIRRQHYSPRPGIHATNDSGTLLPEVHEVLDLIAQHGAVLASGHLSTEETLALVRASRERSIPTIVTHASMWIPVKAQHELASMGAMIEQCANVAMGEHGDETRRTVLEQVRGVGPEHVVLSTDFGQAKNPPPVDGFAWWIDCFLEAGFTESEVSAMVRANPRALLTRGE